MRTLRSLALAAAIVSPVACNNESGGGSTGMGTTSSGSSSSGSTGESSGSTTASSSASTGGGSTSTSSSGGAGGASASSSTASASSSGGAGGASASSSSSASASASSSSSSGAGGGGPVGGGTVYWSRRFGDSAMQSGGVLPDGAGNAWVTGKYSGSLDFGGGAINAGPGSCNLYYAKLDPSHNQLSSTTFNPGNVLSCFFAPAANASGELILSGPFAGTFTLGGGVITPVAGTSSNFYVAKLSSAGAHLWHRVVAPVPSMGPAVDLRVAEDAAGNVFLFGSTDQPIDVGDGTIVATSPGHVRFFVVKYDPAGTRLWTQSYSTMGGGLLLGAIAADGLGNVVIEGQMPSPSAQSYIQFGLPQFLMPAGPHDLYVVHLDSATGNTLWNKDIAGDIAASAFTVDGAGKILAGGRFKGSCDFGGGALAADALGDAFLFELDPSGNHVFSKRFDGPSGELVTGIATSPAGDIDFGGTFFSTIHLPGGTLTAPGSDGFIVRLDAAGSPVFQTALGVNGSITGVSVAEGPAGSVYLGGSFSGTLGLGGPWMTTGISDYDVFVARVGP
jgi:hypothetical protein